MKYTEQTKLTKREKAAVEQLLEACRGREPFSLHFPADEPDTRFFLAEEDDGALSGALSLSRLGDGEYELQAYVTPEKRKQGIFRHLLETARCSIPGGDAESEIRVPVEEGMESAAAVLQHLSAKAGETELELECPLKEAAVADALTFRFRKSRPSAEGVICYEALPPEGQAAGKDADRPVFRAFLMPMGEHRCYLHRIATRKDLIGQGVGKKVLPEFLAVLKNSGYETALLQVAAVNLPAVRLYEGAGFNTRRKLTYYTL